MVSPGEVKPWAGECSAEEFLEDCGGSGGIGFVGVEVGAYLQGLVGGSNSDDAGEQAGVVDVACPGG